MESICVADCERNATMSQSSYRPRLQIRTTHLEKSDRRTTREGPTTTITANRNTLFGRIGVKSENKDGTIMVPGGYSMDEAVVGAESSSSSMSSPIHHLEPSMAASAAHGTAIAICCRGNDGVDHVVILSSAVVSPRQSNLTAPSDALIVMDEEQEEGSLLSLPLSGTRGPVRGIPFWSSSSSSARSSCRGEDGHVHVLGESVVCAATGFAPDVRHVMRVVARSESQNQHYLTNNDAPVDVHSMVRDTLAERLRVAALSDGGRPLGVQCLVVGCGRRRRTTTPYHETTTCWNLHVVDPTGHWRHYGGGATAIGKHASLIRTKLHSLLYGTTTTTTTSSSNEMNPEGMTATTPIMEVSTPKDALDVAMQALLEATTTREELDKKEPSLPDRSYTALVLSRDRNNNNNSHCTYAAFHPDCIQKSYTASLERAFLMTNNEQTA
eukprot:scaffold8419_cov62-Attheya_sp.AAC.16